MKVIDPGHKYEVYNLDGEDSQVVTFVKRFRDKYNHAGTVNQEFLRVLIDRIEFLHKEVPSVLNKDILHHLRMALVLHEARALCRKVEKDKLKPEDVVFDEEDGHFLLMTEESTTWTDEIEFENLQKGVLS